MYNIDVNMIRELFPNNKDFNVVINQENKFIDWERAGVLFDNHLIPSQQGLYMEITVLDKNKDNVFVIEWAVFDNVGYIHWIKIKEKYRRQGISSKVRNEVIKWMFSYGCDEIFTLPSTTAGESLARSQGFTMTDIQPDEPRYTVFALNR